MNGFVVRYPKLFSFLLPGWRLPFRRSEWLMNAFVEN
jgi:hypothetical protein